MLRSDLGLRLRGETAPAHKALEKRVDFDLSAPSRDRAVAMLRSAHGVLHTLEPRLEALLPASLMAGRRKTGLVGRDLALLGTSPPAWPVRRPWLPETAPSAIGALYVLEGSTLGGKLMNRALRTLDAWPLPEPNYFDPYGDRTGSMWAALQAALAEIEPQAADAVVAAADRTFRLMSDQIEEEPAL